MADGEGGRGLEKVCMDSALGKGCVEKSETDRNGPVDSIVWQTLALWLIL